MRNYRHFAIGMNANGSKIKRIVKPNDASAYQMQWYGNVRKENPRWYDIELENGQVFKDRDLYQVITPEGDMSWEVMQ
jgi:hypothetical protein